LVPESQANAEVNNLLRQADEAERQGQVELALIRLRNAVRTNPQNAEAHARLGVLLVKSNQPIPGERELREALESNRAMEELVIPALLQAMLARGEHNELLAEFPDTKDTAERKTAPDIFKARAIVLQALNRPKDAATAMDRSLALRRDQSGLLSRARLAQAQNDFSLALSLADEVSALDPMSEAAATLHVSLLRGTNAFQKALTATDEYISRNPGSVTAKILRGELLMELNRDAEAKAQFTGVLKTAPSSLVARYDLALLMARAGDFRGAWRSAQDFPPEFVQSTPDIGVMVARMAARSGNLETAGSILTALLSRNPLYILARIHLAEVRLSLRAPAEALRVLEPLRTADEAMTQALRAQAYLQLRQFGEATEALEKALSLGGENGLLKQELLLSQLQTGDSDAAVREFKSLVERDPTDVDIAGPLIAALIRQGQRCPIPPPPQPRPPTAPEPASGGSGG
jgi:tetratricopeptide (TPR) repeat protein